MTELSVSDAMMQRGAVREFSDRPVTADLVEELLALAGRAPSGGNVQPWKVYALAGEAKDQLCQAVLARAAESASGDRPDIAIYPSGMGEPWRRRRGDCAELMYGTLGITRADKMARFEQGAKNLVFFGAPVGLIVTMDRSLCESQILDVGLFVQSVLLLAQERGLATCPQASWTMWSGVIREVLELNDTEMVMVGISLGYAAEEAVVNQLSQPRIPLAEFASLRGFV